MGDAAATQLGGPGEQAALAEHAYSAELHGVTVAPQLARLWLDVLLLQVGGWPCGASHKHCAMVSDR